MFKSRKNSLTVKNDFKTPMLKGFTPINKIKIKYVPIMPQSGLVRIPQ